MFPRRAPRPVTQAITGCSVLSGAISTLGASLPLFGAQIIFFFKFGIFIFVTIFLSLVFSLGFFIAALTYVGPLGTEGSIARVYAGVVARAARHIEELEETERRVNLADNRRNSLRADLMAARTQTVRTLRGEAHASYDAPQRSMV